MSYLNSIVNVEIDLASPAYNQASFDGVLLVGKKPSLFSNENAWEASALYTKGDFLKVGESFYRCAASGTSGETAFSQGTQNVNDGSVVWEYLPSPALLGAYSSLEELEELGFICTGDNADPIGEAAKIAFSQNPRPAQIYLALQEVDNGELESPENTLSRALGLDGWYVACPVGIDEENYEQMASFIESQNKLMAYPVKSNNEVVGANYYRSLGVFCKTSLEQTDSFIPSSNNYLHVAFAVKCLSYEEGSETWSYKSLGGALPATLSTAQINSLVENNLNCFVTVGGKNITLGGKVRGGEWIDIIRFRDWLENEMQVRIYSLFLANPKIPYTDNGINLVKNQLLATLKAGVDKGGIALDEYDEDGNLIKGYFVSVPLAANLTATQKASRELTGVSFKARLSGAVHAVEVKGSLGYNFE